MVGFPLKTTQVVFSPLGCILPLYYSPRAQGLYVLANAFLHLAQSFTRSPEGNFAHCRLGFWIRFTVGLYLPRSFTNLQARFLPLPHCVHICAIWETVYHIFVLLQNCDRILPSETKKAIWSFYFLLLF